MMRNATHPMSRGSVLRRRFTYIQALVGFGTVSVFAAVLLPPGDNARQENKQGTAGLSSDAPRSAQSRSTAAVAPPEIRALRLETIDEGAALDDQRGQVAGLPPGDTCENAIRVSPEETFFGNNANTNTGPPTSCGGGEDIFDIWHVFESPCTGTAKIILCGSSFDTTLAAYGFCRGPELKCDDDACLGTAGPSQLEIPVVMGHPYWVRVAGFNGALGNYQLNVNINCCVNCPTGATFESESNCGLPNDTTNGGCNTPPVIPPQFSRITCGQTYCSTAAFDGQSRDTDWYEVVVTSPTQFTWTVSSDFAAQIGLVEMNNPGSGQCANITGVLNPTTDVPSCSTGSVTVCLPPGKHWFFVAPVFADIVNCGARYTATLDCAQCPEACCYTGGGCEDMPRGACLETQGTPQGPGTSCATVVCPQPTEACCKDGLCGDRPRLVCLEVGGTPQGPGTSCTGVTCPLPTGACCASPQACTSSGPCGPLPRCGGSFGCFCFSIAEGGVDCSRDFDCSSAAPCPNGTSSCPAGQMCYVDTCCVSPVCATPDCVSTTADGGAPVSEIGQGELTASGAPPLNVAAAGECIQVDAPTCQAYGGIYHGNFTQCSLVNCPPPLEACCYGAGGCADLVGTDCVNSGGNPQGPGTSCATVHCPLPTGACCADGCFETDRATCNSVGGPYLGDGTVCTGPFCQPDTPCDECGPGPHWVDQCHSGGDLVPTGALVGISTDPTSCNPNVNLVLNGLVSISRSAPRDDSSQFPGLRPVDGHLDVIDTEMLSMRLESNGITIRAGAGTSIGASIRPSWGAIVEQAVNPAMADSFFDVFVEIQMPSGALLYNQEPLDVRSDITCVPPNANYLHPVECVKLFTSPIPGQGLHVANLTSANHSTFPTCGDPGTGECNQPHDTPYCSDEQCCSRVCELRPNCCTQAWDASCVAAAELVCNPGACCLPTCANGGVCGQFQNCGSGGPTPCLCFSAAEGGGTCAVDFACATSAPCPNGTSDCPAGQACYVDTCCGQPSCGPVGCVLATAGTGSPSTESGVGPTAAGGQGNVSGEIIVPTPGCILTDPVRCADLGGVYHGNGTVCTPLTCAPLAVEIDYFPNTTALMELQMPNGDSVPIALSGPTTVHVFFEGANEGDASDNDGDGLDEVQTQMMDMQLTGMSPFGPVVVRLNPAIPSRGEIEEMANTQPGRLDLPPFAPTGTANSFFDVFFEIQVGPMRLHTVTAKRMSSVITHKPPAPGNVYENPERIELLDENGNPTGIFIAAGRHVPRPVVEVDFFPNTTALMELQMPNGDSVPIALSGPTTVHVFFEGANEGDASDNDGDGLDEVLTEMVDMQLTGNSPFGPVVVRLNPAIPSRGEIEETANTQPGRLDLPPFAPTGTANSFFDVFFDIQVGPLHFHTTTPKRMSSVITHKPPAPGNTYENPENIPLLDENGNPTGIFIGAGRHVPRPVVEVDFFPNTTALMELQMPNGDSVPIALSGPTTVHVFFEGANEGDASDNDGDGLDEVLTEMVDMQLTGNSPFGPVVVRLNPAIPSRGEIEETANTQPGRLDLPPFAPTGTANSFFDVFFEIQVGPTRLHTATPKRMSSVITHKPPAPGNTYENPENIPLLDENGNPTGIFIGAGRHVPRPQCGSPGTGDCLEPHNTPFCNRSECCDRVCDLAPNCCTTAWGPLCVGLAQEICGATQACCLPNGQCKDVAPGVCELGGGRPRGPGSVCRGDSNGNIVDDACETCPPDPATSVPPNCAIDARQPYPPRNPGVLQGWNSVAMTFPTGCPVAGAVTGDFTVSTTPAGAAPTVLALGVVGQTVTVTLSSVIPVQKWTCITHMPTGKEVCLGSLPADANSNRISTPVDILDLIDNLNGVRVPPLTMNQCDIDRSNVCAPADMLSEIDLLNGTNGFEVWNGKALPVCPSAP